MTLAAAGVRGTVVDGEGPKLDAVADARWVRTTSEKVTASAENGGNLSATQADATRLRLGLEGSWAVALDDKGATLTPRLSFGVRHDGGDAETGFGVDIGGGVTLAMPARGLSVSLEGRGLLTHEAKGLRDSGFGGTIAWDPAPSSNRGLSLSLRQSVGGSATGGKDALFSREVMEGLAAQRQWRQPAPGGQDRLRAGGIRRPVHRHAGDRLRAVGRRPRLQPRLAPDARGPGRRVVRVLVRSDAARERQRQRSGARHRLPADGAVLGARGTAAARRLRTGFRGTWAPGTVSGRGRSSAAGKITWRHGRVARPCPGTRMRRFRCGCSRRAISPRRTSFHAGAGPLRRRSPAVRFTARRTLPLKRRSG